MKTLKEIGEWALIAAALVGVVAAAAFVVTLGIVAMWLFNAAGFVM